MQLPVSFCQHNLACRIKRHQHLHKQLALVLRSTGQCQLHSSIDALELVNVYNEFLSSSAVLELGMQNVRKAAGTELASISCLSSHDMHLHLHAACAAKAPYTCQSWCQTLQRFSIRQLKQPPTM